MSAGLCDFFQFNLWANQRLLETCASLSDAQLDSTMNGTFGSIRETLVHMLSSEAGYVQSFTRKVSPMGKLETFPGFVELRQRAEESGKALITAAEQANLDQTFWLDGGTYESPAIVVLIQALDHGIDHRSQIATLLSQQGIEPPVLDAWGYNDATLSSKKEVS